MCDSRRVMSLKKDCTKFPEKHDVIDGSPSTAVKAKNISESHIHVISLCTLARRGKRVKLKQSDCHDAISQILNMKRSV